MTGRRGEVLDLEVGSAGHTGGVVGRSRVLLRRVLAVLVTLVVVLVLGTAALFAVTPGVSNAPARVSALARQDGARNLRGGVPRLFAESIVASEDSRFYHEVGIDPIGVARAAWMTATKSGVDPGGSTLSQQLAKWLYTQGQSNTVWDDVEQMTLAVKLNVAYSKPQILRMYADTVYFGHQYFGLHNAACGYFGVPPKRLSLGQASMLAGLVQAPSAYDPLKHLTLARNRQQYVLSRLVANLKITAARARALSSAPLHLVRGPGPRACPVTRAPVHGSL